MTHDTRTAGHVTRDICAACQVTDDINTVCHMTQDSRTARHMTRDIGTARQVTHDVGTTCHMTHDSLIARDVTLSHVAGGPGYHSAASLSSSFMSHNAEESG